MNEADCFCVQSVARADIKTIINKLFVIAENSSFYNFIAAISFIVKQGVPNVLHVYAYLVRPTRFQNTLYECGVAKSFQNLIMGYRFLAIVAFRVGIE